MNIQAAEVKAFVIADAPKLDPIHVYVEDIAPGVGRITITCWGDSWTAFWSGMSGRTISQFFVGMDSGYLSGKLVGSFHRGSKQHERYLIRIIEAVQSAIKAGLP